MSKRKTNVQFIKHTMDYSAHGAMMQMFMLEGLRIYSDIVLSDEEGLRESMQNNFVHPDTWIGCAKEFKAKLDEHLGVKE